MEWLVANWLPLIIVILTGVIMIGILIYLVKKFGLKKVALEAILVAEDHCNSTTGQERLDLAINHVYNLLPAAVTTFLPEKVVKQFLKQFIQKVFCEIKDALDYYKPQLKEGDE